jgi:hypothetical protein
MSIEQGTRRNRQVLKCMEMHLFYSTHTRACRHLEPEIYIDTKYVHVDTYMTNTFTGVFACKQ